MVTCLYNASALARDKARNPRVFKPPTDMRLASKEDHLMQARLLCDGVSHAELSAHGSAASALPDRLHYMHGMELPRAMEAARSHPPPLGDPLR